MTTVMEKVGRLAGQDAESEEVRRYQRRRLDLLNALHGAARSARFFPPQNESVIRKMEELLESIRETVRAEGGAVLELNNSFLMLNESRIKTDVAGLVPYNYMMETMQKLGCGTIGFAEGIEGEELGKFVYLFAKLEPRGDSAYQALLEGFEQIHAGHISIGPLEEQAITSADDEVRKSSFDIYFRSISVARNILQTAHSGKAVNFRHAKRAVQTMVDTASQNEFFLMALSNIKNYDEYTYNHSANVAVLAVTFGQHLEISRHLLGALGMAALFHDIGKTEISHEILNKPGKLTRDEWEILKSHPVLGVKTLLRATEINETLMRSIIVTFEHHKHVNMEGYPETTSLKEINLLSRIVSICDVYDALTTPRSYRKNSYTPAEAFIIMLEDTGTTYDKALLNQFVEFLTLYPVGTLARLDSGEMGLVHQVRHEKKLLDRPYMKVFADQAGRKQELKRVDLAEKLPDAQGFSRNIVEVVAPAKYFKDLNEYLALL